jgi:hypothetical protein
VKQYEDSIKRGRSKNWRREQASTRQKDNRLRMPLRHLAQGSPPRSPEQPEWA